MSEVTLEEMKEGRVYWGLQSNYMYARFFTTKGERDIIAEEIIKKAKEENFSVSVPLHGGIKQHKYVKVGLILNKHRIIVDKLSKI